MRLFVLTPSAIRQQRWHLTAEAMGGPGLLQKRPHVPALLPQGRGHGQQSAAADGTVCGLDAMANPALNHRQPQGPYSRREDFV
jgi:hypothetical protein